MTLARTVALRCATFLVDHASPGWKEWAQGLRAETDFIEKDWQALTWALNGMWVLLDYRPRPVTSFDDLMIAAQKYANGQLYRVNDVWLSRNMKWLIWAVQIFSLTLSLVMNPGEARTWPGAGFKFAGMLTFVVYGILSSGEPDVPDRDDTRAVLVFYKVGMERSFRRTLPVCLAATLLLTVGYALPSPHSGLGSPVFAVVYLILFAVVLRMYSKRMRLVHELEKLDWKGMGEL